MRSAEECAWKVLTPYDPREGIGLKEAAARAGKSETTLRNWCVQHGLGRRVGGGVWIVSKVALAISLDDDRPALAAYLACDRSSAIALAALEGNGENRSEKSEAINFRMAALCSGPVSAKETKKEAANAGISQNPSAAPGNPKVAVTRTRNAHVD
jgi:hypothetical protein